jgi:hypothetical protein
MVNAADGMRRESQVWGDIVALVEMPDEANAKPLNGSLKRGAVVGGRIAHARGIARIIPGHRLEQDRAIVGGPRYGDPMPR